MKGLFVFIGIVVTLNCCSEPYAQGSFAEQLSKLNGLEGLEVLSDGESMLAVSGPLQGRVLTSSSKGMDGRSYGWINEALIKNNSEKLPIAYFGGESRLWFGPEFGGYSLFFDAGMAQVDENMRAPYDLEQARFKEIKRGGNSITYGGKLKLTNTANYVFTLSVERTIKLLQKETIEGNLKIRIPKSVSYVGFSAATLTENIGALQFHKETGLISIWELGCMLTSPDNVVIIPVEKAMDSVTQYFAPVAHRTKIVDRTVFYMADALEVNKIGIPPQFSKNVMGSYSPSLGVLNIVTFNRDEEGVYVNSVPNNKTPYQGDLINIFNGEVKPELDHDWPFYEFESSSSAKALNPGGQMYHWQTTYHFEGKKEMLNRIARTVLGVDLNEIPRFE